MDFSSQIIPAAIIVIVNLVGGNHNSVKYEFISAIFGWLSGISILLYFVAIWVIPEVSDYLLQVVMFSMITIISRDYERILKPFFQQKEK